MRKKYLLIILIIALFTSGIAYAQTSPEHQLRIVVENSVNQAKNNIKETLLTLVTEQINTINEENNIENYSKQLSTQAANEKDQVITSIQSKLNEHIDELNRTVSAIEEQSKEQHTGMVNRINDQTSDLLKFVETDYHDNILQGIDQEIVDKQSDVIMQQKEAGNKYTLEIELTKETIEELKETANSEENPIVKDFIEKKIDFLTELLTILEK
ncbi:hypothetical protein [Neobacillus niacini]|uniref:hypothetical protein n=1 Tax=Neobacillus niacini TaxID=86668 RepID=UPI003982D761